MPIFTPPTDNVVMPVRLVMDDSQLSKEQRLANRLARHFAPGPRGRNVWLLTDNSYTEKAPLASLISKLYHGGHANEITDAEATALTAAGYGANIT